MHIHFRVYIQTYVHTYIQTDSLVEYSFRLLFWNVCTQRALIAHLSAYISVLVLSHNAILISNVIYAYYNIILFGRRTHAYSHCTTNSKLCEIAVFAINSSIHNHHLGKLSRNLRRAQDKIAHDNCTRQGWTHFQLTTMKWKSLRYVTARSRL